MSTPASTKPQDFDDLVKAIGQSHREAGNSSIQEVVLRRVVAYLHTQKGNQHWFCDPYMFPITTHALILFSFPNNGVLDSLKPNMAASLESCDRCVRYFNRGLANLRLDFVANRGIPIDKVGQFLNIIVQWEISVFGPTLAAYANAVRSDSPSLPSPKIMSAFKACLYGPSILRNSIKIRNDIETIISSQYKPTPPNELLAGAIYFLFEGSASQKVWVNSWVQSLRTQNFMFTKETIEIPFIEEFSIHLYNIQDPKYFSSHASVKFWGILYNILDFIENRAFLERFNSPVDIKMMSAYTNLRLYPVLRLFLNNIMAYLKEPLPILLKLLNKFLIKFNADFWSNAAPFTFIQILDTMLSNPEFSKLIFTLPLEKDSMNDYTLNDILSWLVNLFGTLNETNCQTASLRIANFLFKQSSSNSSASTQEIRVIREKYLHEYACKILLITFQFDFENSEYGKIFGLSLLKITDSRAAIDYNAEKLVSLAYSGSHIAKTLLASALSYDIALLAQSTNILLSGELPTSFDTFPILWQALSKSSTSSQNLVTCNVLGAFKKICCVVKISEKKNEVLTKQVAEARAKHNENVSSVFALLSTALYKISIADPTLLKAIFRDKEDSIAVWSCIFCPSVSQAATDILYEVFENGVGRYETIQSLLSAQLRPTLVAVNENVLCLTKLESYEPCPKAVRILMDVLKALTDPSTGILSSSSQVASAAPAIEELWNNCWLFLIMVYRKTLMWANQYHLDELVEFTRDVLDLSHILLDNFRLILDSIHDRSKSHILFEVFMKAYHSVVVWLRLGDTSLLNSCVELVFKGFDLAKDLNFAIDKAFIEVFAKYGAKAKKFNNKLTEQQRSDILSKASEFYPDVVDAVVAEVQLQRTKPKREVSESDGTPTPEPAAFSYQAHQRPPKQQTLARYGVVTSEAPIAPAPKKDFRSSGLDSIRRELMNSRTPNKAPVVPVINPAAPRPAGFNSKKQPAAVGRSLNKLKKKRADSDSSAEESDTDFSDLFVDKSKKKVTVTEVDFQGRPVNRLQKNHVDIARREEENMRSRLNVNLKPLYNTILRWNYNSNKAFPTDERDIYKEIKNQYDDVKDYVKTTEPLLMLECWQGIQSAKQTGQEQPFEIQIGSRTSVDGFFDVYGSVKKTIIADRKVGESDLLVLGYVEQEFSSPNALGYHLKAESTKTCLAKVREIKSANSDFCDITFRVYPSGHMMGVLTPKSQIVAMRVIQMVTIEREYSSLKGLQYYDLCDSILNARPNEPMDISDEDASKMTQIYNVNKSQAKAIMGSYNSEGFSLIQGPPGTGKTKTILGIVGYALSHDRKEKVISTNDGAPSSNENKAKVLICAPSNAAVDELVLRLRDGVRNAQGEHVTPKVVRMGRSDAINASVKDLTLEELVDKELQAKSTESNAAVDHSIRAEHSKCVEERNSMRNKLQTGSLSEKETTELETALRDVNLKMRDLAKRLDEQRERVSIAYRTREIDRRNLQAKILTNAQIICSTLSGSAHDFLANLGITFDQVIIDEACQCVELSAIIPLRYGCKKCIMVGDPNQLPPTVLSQAAASYNYEQSLFVRMQKANPNSVYLLDVQYRMHPSISEFPSTQFYNSRLKDGQGMLEKNDRPWHKQFPLSPYRFFDITSKHQRNELSRSLFNVGEANVTLELVEKLMSIIPEDQFSGRIGIISPYKEQIRTLKNVFTKRYGNSILSQIDFNTVDGFQGQEKEIIIMSCVRASETGNVGFLSDIRRMNVALTRARTTLWILGNKDSLMRNNVWKQLLNDAESRDCVSIAFPGFLRGGKIENAPKRHGDDIADKPTKRSKTTKKAKSTPSNAQATEVASTSVKAKAKKSSIFDSTGAAVPRPAPPPPPPPPSAELIGLGEKHVDKHKVAMAAASARAKKSVHIHTSTNAGSSLQIAPTSSGMVPAASNLENKNTSNLQSMRETPSPLPSSSGLLPSKSSATVVKTNSGIIAVPKPSNNTVQPSKSGTIRPPGKTSGMFIQRRKPPPK
ncbi:DEAD-box type RNA helicase [Scheffersomyces xylosifermentans]|uniref:DEAD-box type RNA helicase n=1 Tax=Scheffersomyces xylosifermentans TaxID=1304137 RepID=UPI00315DBD43